ncbi:MAG: Uncharacterised protein [Prochlorococcus marinus str. MIT 9313]|nr:MAG: Uncharacterised protein [Prochlorococcus marinus str. MIT 9313]
MINVPGRSVEQLQSIVRFSIPQSPDALRRESGSALVASQALGVDTSIHSCAHLTAHTGGESAVSGL